MASRIKGQELEASINKAIKYVNSVLTTTHFKLILSEFKNKSVLSYEYMLTDRPTLPVRVFQMECGYTNTVNKRKAKELLYSRFLEESFSLFSSALYVHKMKQIENLANQKEVEKQTDNTEA